MTNISSYYHNLKLGPVGMLEVGGGGEPIGSLSIEGGDGGKNVTFKVNSRVFTVFHVYSNSLKMSNVGEFLWS